MNDRCRFQVTRRHHGRGATLIELVAAIVIIAIAVLGLTLVSSAVIGRSGDPLVEQQAAALAQAYLDEVSLANFCDPEFLAAGQTCRQQCTARACASGCGGSGALHEASRALYDDVCDYHALHDVGARDRSDIPLAGLGAYQVDVRVRDSGVGLGLPALQSDAGEVVRIDVTVRHAGLDHDVVLSAFRANAR